MLYSTMEPKKDSIATANHSRFDYQVRRRTLDFQTGKLK